MNIIWIVILFYLCGGCGNGCGNGSLFGGSGDNDCCSWAWIIILLMLCCGNGCGCGNTSLFGRSGCGCNDCDNNSRNYSCDPCGC